MDALLDSQHGLTTLLAGLIVILTLHVFLIIAKFIFELARKKTEDYTNALKTTSDSIQKMESRIMTVERDLNEVLKFRQDFRRLFTAIKVLAGDKWPEVRKKIMEDDLSAE